MPQGENELTTFPVGVYIPKLTCKKSKIYIRHNLHVNIKRFNTWWKKHIKLTDKSFIFTWYLQGKWLYTHKYIYICAYVCHTIYSHNMYSFVIVKSQSIDYKRSFKYIAKAWISKYTSGNKELHLLSVYLRFIFYRIRSRLFGRFPSKPYWLHLQSCQSLFVRTHSLKIPDYLLQGHKP